jgi:Transposase IS116/IS110/IS902 family
MTVPGIGPIISSATVAAIGTGDVFSKGRDFGAWLGLVPKQISTGDRTILGRISKRGNTYLRTLFVHAAPRRAAQACQLGALWPPGLDPGGGPAAPPQRAERSDNCCSAIGARRRGQLWVMCGRRLAVKHYIWHGDDCGRVLSCVWPVGAVIV